MEFEEIFQYVGEFGTYQILLYILLGLTSFFPGQETIAMTFIGGDQDHWCKIDRLQNFSYAQQKYIAIPENGKGGYDKCHYYDLPYDTFSNETLEQWNRTAFNGTALKKCEAWDYDQTNLLTTIVSDNDLVCGRSMLVELSSSVYLSGILVGHPISGLVSDRLGRHPTLMIASVLTFVFALAGSFFKSYIGFLVFRFLMSVANAAGFLTAFVIVMEVIGPRFRTLAGILFQGFYSLGFMLMGLMGYYIREHRQIQAAMALPLLALAGYYWTVPESPRWLLSKGRDAEAVKVVRKVAAVNNRRLPSDLSLAQEDKGEPVEKGSFLDLWRHPLLRKELLIMYMAWFTNSLVYYGISLNTGALVGSVYLNTFLSGVVELPALAVCCLAMYSVGRRLTLAVGYLVGGVSCLLCLTVIGKEGLGWLLVTFSMVGKSAISLTFAVVYVYTAELFPTSVRHLAVGSASMMSKVSGIASPFLGKPLMSVWQPLPSLLFGVFALVSGVLSLMLPETLGKKLPETIEDAEEIARSKSTRVKAEHTGTDNVAYSKEKDEACISPL